jgi:steroid 5-alpha reductase family enzyme
MAAQLMDLAALLAVYVFGSFVALWLLGLAIKDSSIVDIWFAPCIAGAAIIGYFQGGGAESRRLLVMSLAIVWGARLGGYLLWRNWGREDPRYARLRKHLAEQGRNFAWHSLTRINLYQAAIVYVMLAPVAVAQVASAPAQLGLLAYAGAALSLTGVLFQGLADSQLARFRADASNANRVLDTGLWRYSRHPNYFGECCVWWGFWLIACEHPWGFWTIVSPIIVTRSILGMMGKELLERRMLKKRPGYQDYVDRTSGFFPWPPKPSSSRPG